MTGGFVYRGKDLPAYWGYYFFTDYCTGRLWALHDSSGTRVFSNFGEYRNQGFSTFGEDRSGELYAAGLESGIVYRLEASTLSAGKVSDPGRVIHIFPNPASDRIWVGSVPGQTSAAGITLYTLSGEAVLQTRMEGNGIWLETGHFIPGMYLLEFRTYMWTGYRKIIIQ